MLKVIIAGGRDFNDFELLKAKCDKILSEYAVTDIQIVSGCAKGADLLGEDYAKVRHLSMVRFPADWNKHGKAAGPIRNVQMAEFADVLIAFHDGNSKGTAHMIRTAKEKGLIVRVIKY